MGGLVSFVENVDKSVRYSRSMEFSIKSSLLTMLAVAYALMGGIFCRKAKRLVCISRWILLLTIGSIVTEFGLKFLLMYNNVPFPFKEKEFIIVTHVVGGLYNSTVGSYLIYRHYKKKELFGIAGAMAFTLSGIYLVIIAGLYGQNKVVNFL